MLQLLALSLLMVLPTIDAGNTKRGRFTLQETWDAGNFFDKFNFRDAAYYKNYNGDPTNGSVNYLSKKAARAEGIAKIVRNRVWLGADSTKKAGYRPNSDTVHGRDSVRLESKETFSSGLLIADIEHQPGGACGTWPSFWTYNFNENPVGEMDIIEGINGQTTNDVSLHTCGKCSFTNIGGSNQRTDCNNGGTVSEQCEDGEDFDGCGNTMSANSYGTGFNSLGGGVYATWLNPGDNFVKIWWWPKKQVPRDITSGNPDPSGWGRPASRFQGGSNCSVKNYFKDLTIIINISFCGDNIDQPTWNAQCASNTGYDTCDDYVANNPQAFQGTYWLFNSIKLYSS